MTTLQLDQTLINAFTSATKDVLKAAGQCQEVKFKGVKAQHHYHQVDGYSTIVYYFRPQGGGVIGLCFPDASAKGFVAKLVNKAPDNVTQADCGDVLGEFTNMISGNAQMKLSQQGYGISDISPPTCFYGHLISTSGIPMENLYMVMSFEVDGLPIYLQICADERYKLTTHN